MRSLADLTNPFLGPEPSQWLVGPIARIATPEEISSYLALRDDGAAADFIRSFWARRNPTPQRPNNPLLDAFEQRGAEADHRFSEAGYLGRRTDRGTIYVLYGPPRKTGFEASEVPGDPGIEVWVYSPDAPAGLDGKKPETRYRFIKRGELTVTYTFRPEDLRRRPRPESPP